MSGYCPDCGNQLCICKDVFAQYEEKVKDLEAKLESAKIFVEKIEHIAKDHNGEFNNQWLLEELEYINSVLENKG